MAVNTLQGMFPRKLPTGAHSFKVQFVLDRMGSCSKLATEHIDPPFSRGTQRIVSVNDLLITYDFLKGIFTSNFRDMGKFEDWCFRIDKNVVSGTEKRSAKIFGKEIRPKVFGKWTKMPW